MADRPNFRRAGRIAMMLVIVGLAFGVPAWARRFRVQADLTAHHKLTLTAETERILAGVDERLEVTGFFPRGSVDSVAFRDLIAQYQRRNRHIRVDLVDPDREPGIAEQFHADGYGSIYFDYSGRRSQASVAAEIEISSAILRVTRGAPKRVCFLVGHGEVELGNDGPAGLSGLGELLIPNNFTPFEVSLAGDPTGIEGCAVVVVPGPATNMLAPEREVLTKWVADNGKLLVLSDPSSDADLRPLLEPYGISPRSELVLDPSSALPRDPSTVLVRRFSSSNPTTRGIAQLLVAEAGSATVGGNEKEGLTVSVLATASEGAQLIARRASDGALAAPRPVKHPILAAAADLSAVQGSGSSASINRTRVVWVGDADFATNTLVGELSNSQFIVNALDWLALDEDLIGIGAPPLDLRRLILAKAESDQIFVGTVVVFPLLVLLAGALTRLAARRRDSRAPGPK